MFGKSGVIGHRGFWWERRYRFNEESILDFRWCLYSVNPEPRATLMPRASKQQTQRNRAKIVAAASRLFRERGPREVSLADIMQTVGLTNGAFYSQFDSRTELVSLACADAFETANARWRRRIASSKRPDRLLKEYVRGYLSITERDDVGGGCAAAGLVGELGKADAAANEREAFVKGLRGMIENVHAMHAAAVPGMDKRETLTLVATLVGALALSRATRGDVLAERLLDVTRGAVLSALAAKD